MIHRCKFIVDPFLKFWKTLLVLSLFLTSNGKQPIDSIVGSRRGKFLFALVSNRLGLSMHDIN